MQPASYRKKIINRALARTKRPAGKKVSVSTQQTSPSTRSITPTPTAHPLDPYPTECPKPLMGRLETYLSAVCDSIEKSSEVSQTLQAQAPAMLKTLDQCLQEQPDFSLKFYVLMSSVLKRVSVIRSDQDYKLLANNLLQLANFFQQTEVKEPDILEEAAKKVTIMVVHVRIIQDFSFRLQNVEPYISLCMIYFWLYCEIDQGIPNFIVENAVRMMTHYVRLPTRIIKNVKNTKNYIQTGKIPPNSASKARNFLKNLQNTSFNSKSVKILYDFFKLTLQKLPQQQPLMKQISLFSSQKDELSSLSVSSLQEDQQKKIQILNIQGSATPKADFQDSYVSDDSFTQPRSIQQALFELDQTINFTKHVLKETPQKRYQRRVQTPPPFLSTSNRHPKVVNTSINSLVQQTSLTKQEVKSSIIQFIVKKIQENPKLNLFQNKNKVFLEFDSNSSWEAKRHSKALRDDRNFRFLVLEAQKIVAKRPQSTQSWRQSELEKDKHRYSNHMEKFVLINKYG